MSGYRGPAPTRITPVPMYSAKPHKAAAQVPVETYIKGTMVTLAVPELTPPGCRPTTVQASTMDEAKNLAKLAIEHAKRMGMPLYNTDRGQAARQRWSSTGDPI